MSGYRTIVADPPWQYDAMPVGGGLPGSFGKARSLGYETMTLGDIKALPVADMAADDAVLWLWTTNKWLPESFAVVKGWGFDYRQTLVWGKNNPMPVCAKRPDIKGLTQPSAERVQGWASSAYRRISPHRGSARGTKHVTDFRPFRGSA